MQQKHTHYGQKHVGFACTHATPDFSPQSAQHGERISEEEKKVLLLLLAHIARKDAHWRYILAGGAKMHTMGARLGEATAMDDCIAACWLDASQTERGCRPPELQMRHPCDPDARPHAAPRSASGMG